MQHSAERQAWELLNVLVSE